jgi:PEP-CTERM motif
MNHSLRLIPALVAGCLMISALPAHADTIDWTSWTSSTGGTNSNPAGAAGTATGTLNGITVTYSGQLQGLQSNYPSWNSSAFTSPTIGNAPPPGNGAIQMEGASSYNETITFSSAITDPVFAIWSLGQGGEQAEYIFQVKDNSVTLVAGGSSSEYGGSSISVNGSNILGATGETVTGNEGNGVVQIAGTFTTITFTTPEYEDYYDFTVGQNVTAATLGATPTPEPGSLSLLGLGLAAVAGIRRKLGR